MDLTQIQNQVLLVVCVVAAIKRHFAWIKGWKSLIVVLLITVAVAYGIAYWDQPWPAYLAPMKQALKVLAYAVGGHAYVSGALKKVGGGGVAATLADLLKPSQDGSAADTTEQAVPREEQPTHPEGRTLPPTPPEAK